MDILSQTDLQTLSRRSFLKLAGSSLLALFWLPLLDSGRKLVLPAASLAPQEITSLGRVLNIKTTLRKKPDFNAEIIKRYRLDEIIPITGVTLGADQTDFNRVWYVINNGDGYTYSGGVQPVEVNNNPVVTSFPEKGLLAEVTVPFTPALRNYALPASVAYRLYYGTTHWVLKADRDDHGKYWYRLLDDKLGYNYWVDPAHLRILTPADVAPLSPEVPLEEKRLEINLQDQVVIAYEGSRAVFMTRTATGARFRDGDYRTSPGTFQTNRKRPSRHMAAGEPGIGSGFDLPGVPWVCYLTKSGVSLHGTYWHNDFGAPRSHGCINLSIAAARWIYRWTTPVVPAGEYTAEETNGTTVIIK